MQTQSDTGRFGWFPSTYVQVLSSEEVQNLSNSTVTTPVVPDSNGNQGNTQLQSNNTTQSSSPSSPSSTPTPVTATEAFKPSFPTTGSNVLTFFYENDDNRSSQQYTMAPKKERKITSSSSSSLSSTSSQVLDKDSKGGKKKKKKRKSKGNNNDQEDDNDNEGVMDLRDFLMLGPGGDDQGSNSGIDGLMLSSNEPRPSGMAPLFANTGIRKLMLDKLKNKEFAASTDSINKEKSNGNNEVFAMAHQRLNSSSPALKTSHKVNSNEEVTIRVTREKRKALVLDQYGFSKEEKSESSSSSSSASSSDPNNPNAPFNNQFSLEKTSGMKKKKKKDKNELKFTWTDYIDALQEGDLSHKSKVKTKHLRCLIQTLGIPPDLRGSLWPRMTNAYSKYKSNINLYTSILKAHPDDTTNPNTKQIIKDLPRTFPNNVWFNTDEVQQSLKKVLIAFTWHHPTLGYCQAMNFLAAMFMFFLQEELSFWMLCTVIEDILPSNYYAVDLMGVRIDVYAFRKMFHQRLPKLAKHFDLLGVDCGTFITSWFLCLFITILPMEAAMRFLDSLFYEGDKMLFQVGLAIFSLNRKSLLETTDTSQLLTVCRALPTTTDIKKIIEHAYEIKITNDKLLDLRKQGAVAILAEQEKHRNGML
eukprot:TRINITY_DN725_c0_g1_i1.p1 TRINITY_DN725_c0_g1~~TRINITY_DN725_c0_g1_i1.p1  ORF type:complete len:643 (-),score=183.89 TRINITY_DN725_c0_g1_i1:231-2159(-)